MGIVYRHPTNYNPVLMIRSDMLEFPMVPKHITLDWYFITTFLTCVCKLMPNDDNYNGI